jgi:hypothetical protein
MIIPRRMLATPLMRSGGVTVLRGLFGAAELQALREESRQQQARAQDVSVARSDDEAIRGGNPARRYRSAPGAAVQRARYTSPALIDTVTSIVGLPVRPSGSAGTFTYYCRPRDFLTIHRDIVTCDVALITCLEDAGVQDSGGKLCVYPTRIWEPLPALRRDPVTGATPLRLAPGDTAIILGGIVPHCTLPVQVGQRRVVSLLCYEAQIA